MVPQALILLLLGVVLGLQMTLVASDDEWPARVAEPGMHWPPPAGWTVPLFEDMGQMHYPVGAVGGGLSERSQQFFDQGLRFVAAFDIGRAVMSFRQAQRFAASRCARCLWGEALALGPNLNAFDEPRLLASVPMAWVRAREAHALHQLISPVDLTPLARRDTALINALLQRFAETPEEFVANEKALRRAYAESMDQAVNQFPGDTLVMVLAAEGWMATHPWDYWLNASSPRTESSRAIELLEEVLRLDPKHGWAVHLYVHITEASARVGAASEYARELPHLFPGDPHTSHMAFHTLMHTGDYDFSEHHNMAASEMERQVYPMHNLDTLGWLCRVQGHFFCAEAATRRLEKIAQHWAKEPHVFETGFPVSRFGVQHLLTLLAFGRDSELLKEDRPPELADNYWMAIWHFARGVAASRLGHADDAAVALEALRRHSSAVAAQGKTADGMPPWAFGNFGGDANWGVFPVSQVLQLAEHELQAHIAKSAGDADEVVAQLRAADAVERMLPYDEPPTWYLPVAGRLGAALLHLRQLEEAKEVYRTSLQRYPRNGWNLFGLLQICEGEFQNLSSGACEPLKEQFKQAWRFADVRLKSSGAVEHFEFSEREHVEHVLAVAPALAASGCILALSLATFRRRAREAFAREVDPSSSSSTLASAGNVASSYVLYQAF